MANGSIVSDEEGAQRLAYAVARRRVELGFDSCRALAREMKVDYRTVTRIENAEWRRFRRTTLVKFELAFAWPPGYTEQLLSGRAGWTDVAPRDAGDAVITQQFINEATTKAIFTGDWADYEVVLAGVRDGRVSVTEDDETLTLRATGGRAVVDDAVVDS